MEKFYIYRKDGSKIRTGGTDSTPEYLYAASLQIDDTFLGQKQCTITIKSPVPVKWEGQEYIIVDGETFTLKYTPKVKKQSRKLEYGEAFEYDSIVMQSLTDETTRVKFLDYVLEDNLIHYSAMPTVYFYGTVKDLAMRIQANMDRVYTGVKKWTVVLGEDLPTKEKQKTYQNASTWDAITDIWNEYKTLFYIKGRTIHVGGDSSTVPHDFMYGIGNGLKTLEKSTDEKNEIITRLHVYGSQKNLPYRYYNNLGTNKRYWVTYLSTNVASTDEASLSLRIDFGGDFYSTFFRNKKLNNKTNGIWQFAVTVRIGDVYCPMWVEGNDGSFINTNRTIGFVFANSGNDNYDKAKTLAMIEAAKMLKNGDKVYITDGVDYDRVPAGHVIKEGGVIGESLYLPNLMLPCIRIQGDSVTLYDKDFNVTTDESKAAYRMVKTGFGGKDMDMYLESVKGINHFGVLEGCVTFDNNNDKDFEDYVDDENGIYPTLSSVTDGSNEIVSATQLTDAGIFDAQGNITPKTFEVVVKPGFNPVEYKISGETPQISFKTGALIGRTFNFTSSDNKDGTYTLLCNRINDDSIGLAFPNYSYNVKKGDKFVFLGIELPDELIQKAELRLLKAGLAYLANYDHTKFTYSPELDNIFLERNKDIRDSLCAGANFRFTDADVNNTDEDAETIKLPISKLETKIGNSAIREYSVTLADTPDIDSDIIQRTIKAVSNAYSSGVFGGGVSDGDIKIVGDKYYLSKNSDDKAAGLITFLRGLQLGNNGRYGLTEEGVATLKAMYTALFAEGLLGTGFGMWTKQDGTARMEVDELLVRKVATFLKLDIRELSYVGGNIVLSKTGSEIKSVEEARNADGTLKGWICRWTDDDGRTATTNQWVAGDLARCQTFDIKAGVYENVTNRYYWRRVDEVGDGYVLLSAIDYDDAGGTISNDNASAVPKAGDKIVQMGCNTAYGGVKDESRTTLLMLSTSGDNAPSIEAFANVTSYSLAPDKTRVFIISPKEIELTSERFKWRSGSVTYAQYIFTGDWVKGRKYGYYQGVTHSGSTWVCVNTNGTTEEPSPTAKDWKVYAAKGEDGTSVKVQTTMTEYQASADGTKVPTGTWQKAIPIVAAGQYLWSRTTVKYSDGNSTTTYAVSRMGTNGTSVTVTSTEVRYAVTKDAKQPDDAKFTSKTVPSLTTGDYLWTRTVVKYSDSKSTKTYSVSRIGADGAKGQQGPTGADGKTYYVHFAYANSSDGSKDFSLTYFANALYVGTCTDTKEEDPQDYHAYTWARFRGENGKDGKDGVDGKDGQGVSLKGATDSEDGLPKTGNSEGDGYLVNGILYIFTNGKWVSTGQSIKGPAGKDGTDGTNGADGKDGKTTYVHIAYANDTKGTDFSTTYFDGALYIGTCTDFNYEDPKTYTAYEWARFKGEKGDKGEQGLRGLQGEQGEQGIQGEPGADGQTTYFHIKYSSVARPTSSNQMTETPSEYIGTYVDYTKEDSLDPNKYTWSRFQGIQGPKGDQGIKGDNGTDGKTYYLHIAYANSADGKTDFTNGNPQGKSYAYIGQYTDEISQDSSNPADYVWSLIKGEKGDTGNTGPTGPKGDTGASGWGWAFTPNTLTFETNDKGEVQLSGNSAVLTANYGGKPAMVSITSATAENCGISNTYVGKNTIIITSIKNSTQITTADNTTYWLPASAGYVTVVAKASITDDSGTARQINFTARIDFTVAITKCYSNLIRDINGLTSTVGEVRTDVTSLTETVSKIEQKSDSITATVAKTTVTGRNMIKGSMLRKVVRVNTANQMRKVNLTAGKTYTLSARGYVSQALKAAGLDMRVFVYTADGTGAWVDSAVIPFSETDGWTEKELTFTAKKTAEYSVYVQVCKDGMMNTSATETQVGFIDTIQLEEGEVATPWSPVADDFTSREIVDIEPWTTQAAYMTTVPVTLPDGTTGNVAHADMRAKTGVADILFKNDAFEPNGDETYTLTFYAKGTGRIESFLYLANGKTDVGVILDGSETAVDSNGISTMLTTDWRLHSVTFTTRADISAVKRHVIAARVPQGSEAWVCFPLMEKGGMTFGDTDDGKLATGVDIRRRRVTVTADKFVIQNNKGEQTFGVDENGNIYGKKDGNSYKARFIGAIEADEGKFDNGTIDKATITNATISSGTIGGFVIDSGRIGIDNSEEDKYKSGMFLYGDMIGFKDVDAGKAARIGIFDYFGFKHLGVFMDNNTDSSPLGRKCGINFDISGTAMNFAFVGNGNGVLNGWIGGTKLSKIKMTTADTYADRVTLASNNKWMVSATVSGARLMLPTLTFTQLALFSGGKTPFSVELTIMGDITSTATFNVYGRYSAKNDEGIPVMLDANGGYVEHVGMGKGDTLKLMIVYDPDCDTLTAGGYKLGYTARIMSLYT